MSGPGTIRRRDDADGSPGDADDCPDEADDGPDDHLCLAGAQTFASADLPLLGSDLHVDEDADPRRSTPLPMSDSVRQKLKLISAADVERAVASKKLTNVS
ncbi:hypothetical protein [Streptomyces noursei]|uniref:hypothetical protein n=1 Tax=Streptomyces noursei TaxID=1971 RepID=UPI00167349E8|nr:hypothetical protein [Streptomyces noursei]MCZ1013580.1 hypothetical protein [Streptomyces noursei]GGX25674.1 hypothetical protein GCM10010341_53700 [Streptomyces noursei]